MHEPIKRQSWAQRSYIMLKMNILGFLGLICSTFVVAGKWHLTSLIICVEDPQGAMMDDDFDYEAFKVALDELTEGKIIWR